MVKLNRQEITEKYKREIRRSNTKGDHLYLVRLIGSSFEKDKQICKLMETEEEALDYAFSNMLDLPVIYELSNADLDQVNKSFLGKLIS